MTLAHCEKKWRKKWQQSHVAGRRGGEKKCETDAEAPDFSFTENATAGPQIEAGCRPNSLFRFCSIWRLEYLKMRRDSENKTKSERWIRLTCVDRVLSHLLALVAPALAK